MPTSRETADAVIARLARAQYGVMHRRQLRPAGVTVRQIGTRLDNGRLLALGNGVLAVPSAPPTYLRQYKAAELAVPDAAVCALAAARLHDLGATRTAAAEIAVHPSANHRCELARVHRRHDVLVTTVHGIRATTVAQTLIDVSDRVRLSRLEATWTSALVRRRVTLDDLAERVTAAEAQRLSHRGTARAMLDSLVVGSDLADSELEVMLFDIAEQVPGIPPLVRQMPLPWWRAGTGRCDVGVPAWRMILEADGRAWHARLADFERDRRRDNLAAANGYVVLRFAAVHLQRRADEVIGLIAAAGRHRTAS